MKIKDFVPYPLLMSWQGAMALYHHKWPKEARALDHDTSHKAVVGMVMAWQRTALALGATVVNKAAFFAGKTVIALYLPAASATLSFALPALTVVAAMVMTWFIVIMGTTTLSDKSGELAFSGLCLSLGTKLLMTDRAMAIPGILVNALGYGFLVDREDRSKVCGQILDGDGEWFQRNAKWLAQRWIPEQAPGSRA